MKKRYLFLISTLALLTTSVSAQAFRFIDESGNIHFVDSVNEIPSRYRDQVLYPTPVPTWNAKVRNTPTPKPTRKPKPTKTPKIKKNGKGSSFFPGSYPAPGQLPSGAAVAPLPPPGGYGTPGELPPTQVQPLQQQPQPTQVTVPQGIFTAAPQ